MSELPIEQIETHLQTKQENMTTVIAIKCEEGVVIASDSQSTSPVVKNMQVSKIYQINKYIGIGASGAELDIKVLVEALQRIRQDDLKSEQNLKESIKKIMLDLHKEYNSERSSKLEFNQINFVFQPEALLGAKLLDGCFCLFHIMYDSWIDTVDNYQIIGSGFPLANLVIRQQNRYLNLENKKLSELPLVLNIWISTIVINEVKAVEPNTGGNTNIVIVNKDGYNEVPDKDQQEFYRDTVNIVSSELGKRFSVEKNKDLKDIFPHN
jgi:20S proteasome alpha/beta subunit